MFSASFKFTSKSLTVLDLLVITDVIRPQHGDCMVAMTGMRNVYGVSVH